MWVASKEMFETKRSLCHKSVWKGLVGFFSSLWPDNLKHQQPHSIWKSQYYKFSPVPVLTSVELILYFKLAIIPTPFLFPRQKHASSFYNFPRFGSCNIPCCTHNLNVYFFLLNSDRQLKLMFILCIFGQMLEILIKYHI